MCCHVDMWIQMCFQGFIVASPQLTNNSEIIASLGTQYPPGTSFTIVPGKSECNTALIRNSIWLSLQWILKRSRFNVFLQVSVFCLSAGQQQLFQRVTPGTVLPGVVHRPQVQQISNNIVTLSNVQSPAVYSAKSNQLQNNRSNTQTLQTITLPVKASSNNRGTCFICEV